MWIWGLRGLILFFRQASAGPFSFASHGFNTVVIFFKNDSALYFGIVQRTLARGDRFIDGCDREVRSHMTKVLLSSIMLRRIPLFN